MSGLEGILRRTKTITFDCYGTLIDWRAGLARSFGELLGPGAVDRADELFQAYARIEAQIEAEEYRPYRQVLSMVAQRLAKRFGFELSPQRAELLAETLPRWPPFGDTNAALALLKQRYRLGVLSNIDGELFAGTARQFEITFDFVVTAQDVRAYKPAHAHFERLISMHCNREEVLHVAQSLFHDGAPADRLGLAFVWLNRYEDVNETTVRPLAIYPDLVSFAKAARGTQ